MAGGPPAGFRVFLVLVLLAAGRRLPISKLHSAGGFLSSNPIGPFIHKEQPKGLLLKKKKPSHLNGDAACAISARRS